MTRASAPSRRRTRRARSSRPTSSRRWSTSASCSSSTSPSSRSSSSSISRPRRRLRRAPPPCLRRPKACSGRRAGPAATRPPALAACPPRRLVGALRGGRCHLRPPHLRPQQHQQQPRRRPGPHSRSRSSSSSHVQMAQSAPAAGRRQGSYSPSGCPRASPPVRRHHRVERRARATAGPSPSAPPLPPPPQASRSSCRWRWWTRRWGPTQRGKQGWLRRGAGPLPASLQLRRPPLSGRAGLSRPAALQQGSTGRPRPGGEGRARLWPACLMRDSPPSAMQRHLHSHLAKPDAFEG